MTELHNFSLPRSRAWAGTLNITSCTPGRPVKSVGKACTGLLSDFLKRADPCLQELDFANRIYRRTRLRQIKAATGRFAAEGRAILRVLEISLLRYVSSPGSAALDLPLNITNSNMPMRQPYNIQGVFEFWFQQFHIHRKVWTLGNWAICQSFKSVDGDQHTVKMKKSAAELALRRSAAWPVCGGSSCTASVRVCTKMSQLLKRYSWTLSMGSGG